MARTVGRRTNDLLEWGALGTGALGVLGYENATRVIRTWNA